MTVIAGTSTACQSLGSQRLRLRISKLDRVSPVRNPSSPFLIRPCCESKRILLSHFDLHDLHCLRAKSTNIVLRHRRSCRPRFDSKLIKFSSNASALVVDRTITNRTSRKQLTRAWTMAVLSMALLTIRKSMGGPSAWAKQARNAFAGPFCPGVVFRTHATSTASASVVACTALRMTQDSLGRACGINSTNAGFYSPTYTHTIGNSQSLSSLQLARPHVFPRCVIRTDLPVPFKPSLGRIEGDVLDDKYLRLHDEARMCLLLPLSITMN